MKNELLNALQKTLKPKKITSDSKIDGFLDSIEYIKAIICLEAACDIEFDDKMLLLNAFDDIENLINYAMEKAKIASV